MKHFKIPEDSRGMMRVSYKDLQEYLTERAASGLPLPEGLEPDEMITEHSLTARVKKGIELTSHVQEYVNSNQ